MLTAPVNAHFPRFFNTWVQVILSWAGWPCLNLGQQKFRIIVSVGQTQQESAGFRHAMSSNYFCANWLLGKRMECPPWRRSYWFYQMLPEDMAGEAVPGSGSLPCICWISLWASWEWCRVLWVLWDRDTQTAPLVSVVVVTSAVVCFAAHRVTYSCKI